MARDKIPKHSDIAKKIKEGFVGQRLITVPKEIITSLLKNPLINSLYLTDIGFFPKAKHHFFKRKHGSKQYILIYCHKGHGIVKVNEKELYLGPNTFFIVPPNTKHVYHAIKKDPWSIYWVHFTGVQAVHIYEKFKETNSSGIPTISLDERRINLFENLMDILEDGYSSHNMEYVNLSLWQLLNSFLFHEFFTEIGRANPKNIIDEVIEYMKKNIEEPLSVDGMAVVFNYSSSHFFSLFKRKTGYSPIQYFNHLKIQKASQYLSFTTLSVKEISFSLGFNDPLYFSRLFKKTQGVSPLQYRKEYQH